MSFYVYVPVLVRSGSAVKTPQPSPKDLENTKLQQAREERKNTPYDVPSVEQRLARRSERLKSRTNAELLVEGKLKYRVPRMNRGESSMKM